jgi:SAM-dependent methyltransferase
MLPDSQDAYGHEMLDYMQGKPVLEIIERDDRLIEITNGPKTYFAPFKDWPEHEKQAIRFAKGRVLDVGCGAGRALLYLQEKGIECVGIDASSLAVKVSRERGVKDARVISITRVGPQLGKFDSILMFGNNFSLLGGKRRGEWVLEKFRRLANPGVQLIVTSTDPYATTDQDHLSYQKFNARRSRMAGQIRLRVRYRKYQTPWLDHLLVSQQEMSAMLKGNGWKVTKFVPGANGAYAAVIQREDEA